MSKRVVTSESQKEGSQSLEVRADLREVEKEFLDDLEDPGSAAYLVETPGGDVHRVPSVEDIGTLLEDVRERRGTNDTAFEPDVLEYNAVSGEGTIVYEFPSTREDMSYETVGVRSLDNQAAQELEAL